MTTPIDQRWAIIAHLDVLSALEGEAKCRLVLVDLEAGRHAGELCVAARQWEKRRDVFSIPTDDLTVSVPVVPPNPDAPQPPVTIPRYDDEPEPDELEPAATIAPTGTPNSPVEGTPDGVEGSLFPTARHDEAVPSASTSASPSGEPVASDPPSEEPPATPTAVEAPPTESFTTSVGGEPAPPVDEERRRTLMARYNAMHPHRKRRFRERCIPKHDLDAIEAALDDITNPPTMRDRAQERMATDAERAPTVLTRALQRVADEGKPVPDADFDTLQDTFRALPKPCKDWFAKLIREANAADVSFQATNNHTLRRYEIYRGLIHLAAWFGEGLGFPEDHFDAALIALVWAAANSDDSTRFANVAPGHALGSLDAAEAATFARLADTLTGGGSHLEVDDNDTWRYVAA